MIIEVAHFALILAFTVAIFAAIVPVVGYIKQDLRLQSSAIPFSLVLFFLIFISFSGLVYGFVTDDFTVSYIASHSYSDLPLFYKFCAVWGAHEGSMLLWILTLTGWSAAVALFSRTLPIQATSLVLAVMAMITLGFISFSLFTSNPFERLLPFYPIDGRDLNPLLQDIGFIIHPPFLYMGYVGFSVAFAFSIAALISGQLDSAWARWSRPWTTLAWVFLTIGIMLGSWWAYYELGWGGWWFWDPVENASFMPWLTGTALLHSLAVSEKRGGFKSWTVFLALLTFSLSLLGTFIVRSGVITSVHSFAQDPVRGLYILIFMGIVVVASLGLFVYRSAEIKSNIQFSWISKEVALLFNNLLLCFAFIVVFLGTLFPLIMEAFEQSVSVGAPYFNQVFPVFFLPLLALLGFGHWLQWKKQSRKMLVKRLQQMLVLQSLLLVVFGYFIYQQHSVVIWAGVVISIWIVSSIVTDVFNKISQGEQWYSALKRVGNGYWGMQLAHFGLAMTLTGIVVVSLVSDEHLIRLGSNESFTSNDWAVTFKGTRQIKGPNYTATRGEFLVESAGKSWEMHSEKRQYTASGQVMTEAGIDSGFFRDFYISLGEPLGDGDWSVRIYIKAFIRWIWLGAIFMALGGLLATTDKRYRVKESS